MTVCVCLLCRLKVDLANLAGTSLPAEVQAQIKAQLMDITKRRTEVQHHATVEHVTSLVIHTLLPLPPLSSSLFPPPPSSSSFPLLLPPLPSPLTQYTPHRLTILSRS